MTTAVGQLTITLIRRQAVLVYNQR